MIGIAGARRTWNEQSAKGGGWSHIEIIPCSSEEVGYTGDIKDLAAAFRAEAHDSGATSQYQKLFTETIKAMRESGSTDPFGDAKQICGPRPMWVGYGYSTVSETSRMNKTQLARKRAEADALKKCINIPFGVEVSAEYETAPNITTNNNVEVIDARVTTAEESQFTDEELPVVELIVPAGEWAVKHASQVWGCTAAEAAPRIYALKLGGKVGKSDFIKIVEANK